MTQHKRLIVPLLLMALVALPSACFAIFPKPDYQPNGYGLLDYRLSMGWYDNAQAWYTLYDGSTNNINLATRNGPHFWLAPALSSALVPRLLGGDIAARPMYIVLNPSATQGPVFSTAPGEALYSGLWQVFYITWNAGATKRPITNSNPSPDPQGLPSAAEATIAATSIVVQYPVLALGPLGGPWIPAPPGTYRMPQVVASCDYARSKEVYLPTFMAFCTDPVSRLPHRQVITLPDVSDSTLAALLGANLAPGLLNVPDSDTAAFWSILSSPYLCQLPVLEQCPDGAGRTQRNQDFSPILRLTYLNRVGLPQSTVINNPSFLLALYTSGHLVLVRDDQRLGALFFNAPTQSG